VDRRQWRKETEMNCKEKLQEHLVANGVSFELEQHKVAYTAQDLAAAEHVSGKRVAKAVVALVDGQVAMFVLPASNQADLEKARAELGAEEVRLAREDEFAAVFPDCEVGAMPPFGSLYGIPVYVDQTLANAREITFPAGSHRESMKIAYSDFERLEQPTSIRISIRAHAAV
jgi:Ala-tRNA(Pro) deacylase